MLFSRSARVNTRPPTTTAAIWRVLATSVIGSAVNRIRSARLPASTVPRSAPTPSHSLACRVALSRIARSERPARLSASISSCSEAPAASPGTEVSVPTKTGTPASAKALARWAVKATTSTLRAIRAAGALAYIPLPAQKARVSGWT